MSIPNCGLLLCDKIICQLNVALRANPSLQIGSWRTLILNFNVINILVHLSIFYSHLTLNSGSQALLELLSAAMA